MIHSVFLTFFLSILAGRGQFTDPHPFTCSFFTPAFFCSMLGLYALLSVLSNQPSEWRKNLFSIEAVPCFNVLPLQAQLGLFFLFCLSSVSLDSPLSERRLYSFLSSGVFRLHWIRPQLPHPAPTGPVTRLAGVVPLPGFQNRTQHFTGRVYFFSLERGYPSP